MLLSNLMNKILHGSQWTSMPYFLRFRYVAPSTTPSFVHQEYEINLGVGVLALGFPLAFAILKHGGEGSGTRNLPPEELDFAWPGKLRACLPSKLLGPGRMSAMKR